MSRCHVCGTKLAETARRCYACHTPVAGPVDAPSDSDVQADAPTPPEGVPVIGDFESYDPGAPTPPIPAPPLTLPPLMPPVSPPPAAPPMVSPPLAAPPTVSPPPGAPPPESPPPVSLLPARLPPVAPPPGSLLPVLAKPAQPAAPVRRRRMPVALVVGVAAVLVMVAAAAYGVLTHHPRATSTKNPRPPSTPGTAGSHHPSKTPPTTHTTLPPTTTAQANAELSAWAQKDASGVVSIAATTCNGTGEGSGFLVTPTLVVTNAHVVDGAVGIGLTSDGVTRTGQVIGLDESADVALIQLGADLPGHVFSFGSNPPSLGTAVGVVGYLDATSLHMVPGLVGNADSTVSNAGQTRSGLMQTNAAVSPGQAGGPVLATDGSVVGLADAAIPPKGSAGYIVPAAEAASLVAGWEHQAAPPPPPSCPHPLGPASAGTIRDVAGGGDGSGIAATLSTYFNAIDGANYGLAYAQLGPQPRLYISEPTFAMNDATTYDYNVVVQSVSTYGFDTDLADVAFTSLQSAGLGPNGNTCDIWTLQYTMIKSGSGWLIDGATGQNGVTNLACTS